MPLSRSFALTWSEGDLIHTIPELTWRLISLQYCYIDANDVGARLGRFLPRLLHDRADANQLPLSWFKSCPGMGNAEQAGLVRRNNGTDYLLFATH